MKQQITDLRVKIDALSQLTKLVLTKENHTTTGVIGDWVKTSYSRSPNIQRSHDSLKLAKARLGEIFHLLGEDQAADEAHNKLHEFLSDGKGNTWTNMTNVEKLKHLQHEIEGVREECAELSVSSTLDFHMSQCILVERMNYSVQLVNLLSELDNARFYLGFELDNIQK